MQKTSGRKLTRARAPASAQLASTGSPDVVKPAIALPGKAGTAALVGTAPQLRMPVVGQQQQLDPRYLSNGAAPTYIVMPANQGTRPSGSSPLGNLGNILGGNGSNPFNALNNRSNNGLDSADQAPRRWKADTSNTTDPKEGGKIETKKDGPETPVATGLVVKKIGDEFPECPSTDKKLNLWRSAMHTLSKAKSKVTYTKADAGEAPTLEKEGSQYTVKLPYEMNENRFAEAAVLTQIAERLNMTKEELPPESLSALNEKLKSEFNKTPESAAQLINSLGGKALLVPSGEKLVIPDMITLGARKGDIISFQAQDGIKTRVAILQGLDSNKICYLGGEDEPSEADKPGKKSSEAAKAPLHTVCMPLSKIKKMTISRLSNQPEHLFQEKVKNAKDSFKDLAKYTPKETDSLSCDSDEKPSSEKREVAEEKHEGETKAEE